MVIYHIFLASENTTCVEIVNNIEDVRKILSEYKKLDVQAVIKGGVAFYPTNVKYIPEECDE